MDSQMFPVIRDASFANMAPCNGLVSKSAIISAVGMCIKITSLVGKDQFHSAVMTLHYLPKSFRPDILTAVSYCATRVKCPTEDDQKIGQDNVLFEEHRESVLGAEHWRECSSQSIRGLFIRPI